MDAVKSAVESAAGKVAGAVTNRKAIHFGGGNIGRGLIGEQLHKAGYEVIFVDVVDDLINKLKEVKEYKVTEIGTDSENTITINNYRALHSRNDVDDIVHEIATGDIVTCAVGPTILNRIAGTIARGIDARELDYPLAVVACENAINATDTLAKFIRENFKTTTSADEKDKVRFANCAIDRIVPGQDANAGLNVKIEKFYEWCVEQTPFQGAKGGHPNVPGIHWVDALEPYIERKLFTVNTSHATAAYYGHVRGERTIHDAMNNPEIKAAVTKTLEETAHLIVTKHGIDKKEQEEYVQTIVKRISNPHLEDIVERVGRAPLRKLSRKERFIGPASQLAEMGQSVDNLLGGIEMALRFQDVEGDEESFELKKILAEKDATAATEHLTGLEKSHPLFSQVEKVVAKVQGK